MHLTDIVVGDDRVDTVQPYSAGPRHGAARCLQGGEPVPDLLFDVIQPRRMDEFRRPAAHLIGRRDTLLHHPGRQGRMAQHPATVRTAGRQQPVVAVADSNSDPDLIDYAIPGNDDAIRAGELMSRVISDAVLEGRFIRSKKAEASGESPAQRNVLEEAEIAEQQAKARAEAAAQAAEREARIAAEKDAAESAPSEDAPAAAEEAPEDAMPAAGDEGTPEA